MTSANISCQPRRSSLNFALDQKCIRPGIDRQRVEKSFKTLLDLAGIREFRFHDLRHTFASWYMLNGGDLYELAQILGHSNIRMTERYAKLGMTHIAKTGDTAKAMWGLMAGKIGERAASAV